MDKDENKNGQNNTIRTWNIISDFFLRNNYYKEDIMQGFLHVVTTVTRVTDTENTVIILKVIVIENCYRWKLNITMVYIMNISNLGSVNSTCGLV